MNQATGQQREIAYKKTPGPQKYGLVYIPGLASHKESTKPKLLHPFAQENGFSYVRWVKERDLKVNLGLLDCKNTVILLLWLVIILIIKIKTINVSVLGPGGPYVTSVMHDYVGRTHNAGWEKYLNYMIKCWAWDKKKVILHLWRTWETHWGNKTSLLPQVRPHWSRGIEGCAAHGHRVFHVGRRCIGNLATCDRGTADYCGFIYGLLGESFWSFWFYSMFVYLIFYPLYFLVFITCIAFSYTECLVSFSRSFHLLCLSIYLSHCNVFICLFIFLSVLPSSLFI